MDKGMNGTIKELCHSNAYSHVFISHSLLGNFINLIKHLLPDATIITDAYRSDSDQPVRITFKNMGIHHKLSAARARWNEQKLMNKTGLLLAASEWDALLFKALSFKDAPKVHVLPHFIDMNQYHFAEATPKENLIVLHWKMNSIQGKKAFQMFYHKIYPSIMEKVPDVKCFIVGSEVSPEIRRLVKEDESVVITGPLADPGRYIRRAKAFIAPLQEGCGSRSKILESWALRTPVVTSYKGSERLICQNNRNILLANNTYDFAEKVVRLLEDPKLGSIIADRAHQTLLNHYEANSVKEKVFSLI
ncbi:glycosyltransferase family 4 protein [Paenibacillus wynnii]|uniref:glycosyltransferase family 4 protein n=1 Tax=Paenibacillus wynnii TaxID=268407 RepID=UPI0027D7B200|nr:glycosyltransferase family 4 protein [Paenibacillus wynnii]